MSGERLWKLHGQEWRGHHPVEEQRKRWHQWRYADQHRKLGELSQPLTGHSMRLWQNKVRGGGGDIQMRDQPPPPAPRRRPLLVLRDGR